MNRERHWIEQVTEGGRYVHLDDGSTFEVDVMNRTDALLWHATTEVLVVKNPDGSYTLINRDDREEVKAEWVR